jgi:glycosyltransferase involved in cell wall biosynthesis
MSTLIDRKINILHIIGSLPIGGAEMLLLTLAANINLQRINMIVCCLYDEGPLAEEIRKYGIKVICLKVPRFRYAYRRIFNLIKIIKTEKVDIVHTHMQYADFMGRLIARVCNVPIICKTRHFYRGSSMKGSPEYATWYLRLNVLLDYFTDMVIYVSNSQMSVFKKRERNRCVISNAVYEKRIRLLPDARQTARNVLGIAADEILVGSLARLHKIKGQEYLVRAIYEMRKLKNDIKVKLILMGDGDIEHDLRLLAERLQIGSNVIFSGRVNDVSDTLQALDIYVHPSIWEAFSVAVIEAMYCGVPVVVTNVGVNPEIITHRDNGILVEPGDSAGIARAVLELIENLGLAEKIAKKGRETVLSKYTGRIYAENFMQLYENMMRRCEHKPIQGVCTN